MAIEDFDGGYEVTTSSGTQFGIGTEVQIWHQTNDSVLVIFQSPLGMTQLSGTYDDQADALRLPIQNGEVMYISRYVDSDPSKAYRSIYGIVINTNPAADARIYLPVWSALPPDAQSTGSSGNPLGSTDSLAPSDFVGEYFIRTTADSQFGVVSTVSITESESGSDLDLDVTNALGNSVLSTELSFDSDTVSVIGETTGTVSDPDSPDGTRDVRLVFAMSIATEVTNGVETKYGYGIVTVGDPEQGGTFGGEEGGP